MRKGEIVLPLEVVNDYALMLGTAALCGAIGGLVFELLQGRNGNDGQVERPGRSKNSSFYDLGWIASVVVGAVAAVAVLYFFPPVLNVGPDGETTLQYDFVKLVALSLITGSAGGSVMKALQSRVLASLEEQRAKSTRAVAQTQVDQFGQNIEAEARDAMQSSLKRAQTQIGAVIREARAETPLALRGLAESGAAPEEVKSYVADHPPVKVEKRLDEIQTALASAAGEASEKLGERMRRQVDVAQATIASIADPAPGARSDAIAPTLSSATRL